MPRKHIIGALQVEFVCPKCKKRLAWAIPSASINCPKCGTWVTNENRLVDKAEMYLPVDSEQFVLFKE